jgi:hypothetical protein
MYESEAFLKITIRFKVTAQNLGPLFPHSYGRNFQLSGSVNIVPSSSPILAEAKDSKDSTVEREEAVSSESVTISSCRIM